MLTSLFTGVSGLNANMMALSVIGNNIANMNTVGFKSSRPSFAEILSQTTTGISGQSQIGLGVTLSSVTPLFTQGPLETTKSPLDMAIEGDGFFVLRDNNGAVYYSRAGQFNINKEGYIVNPEGYILRGYQADNLGNLSNTIGDLQVSFAMVPPHATENISIFGNMNSEAEIKGFVFTTDVNDKIRFRVDGGSWIEVSLITDGGLTSGTAYTGGEVANAIKVALEANNGNSDTYYVSYDEATGKFTITNNASNSSTIELGWGEPETTAAELLGFDPTNSGEITPGSSDESDKAAGQFFVDQADETSNFATSITVYDSLGNDHQVTIYFRKALSDTSGNKWEWFAVVDASDSSSGKTEIQAQGTLTFDTSGALVSESAVSYLDGGFNFTGGADQKQTINFNFGTSIVEGGTGIDGLTQYGSASAIYNQQQDGYGSGSLQNISINSNGLITGIFSNGKTRILGQVALADFANPAALISLGKNLYAESVESGQALIGTPGSSGRGTIHSHALELSTVDIAEEFVKMISAQRGFQANSRVITTTDEILSELVNLKR